MDSIAHFIKKIDGKFYFYAKLTLSGGLR